MKHKSRDFIVELKAMMNKSYESEASYYNHMISASAKLIQDKTLSIHQISELTKLHCLFVNEFIRSRENPTPTDSICFGCMSFSKCPFVCLRERTNQYVMCPKQKLAPRTYLYVTEVKRKKLGRTHLN